MPTVDNPRANQEMPSMESNTSPGSMLSPTGPANLSPIRPVNPDPPKPRLNPAITRPTLPEIPSLSLGNKDETPTQVDDANLSPAERAERALEQLREKMNALVQEYAAGDINQVQFQAIYRRYSEQRDITERLLQRNPESGAWQSVVQAGHTSFLRDHYSAKILSYGLYRIMDGAQIVLQGKLRLPPDQLLPIIAKLKRLVDEGRVPPPAGRKLKDNSWVYLVPGKVTASVMIYSLEPAAIQRQVADDIQRDFERANEKILARGDFDPNHLVFPHRALFE